MMINRCMTSGIYKIENKINGKVYIGRSHTDESRENMSKSSTCVKYYEYDGKTFRGLQKLADYIGCTYMVAFHHCQRQTLQIIKKDLP